MMFTFTYSLSSSVRHWCAGFLPTDRLGLGDDDSGAAEEKSIGLVVSLALRRHKQEMPGPSEIALSPRHEPTASLRIYSTCSLFLHVLVRKTVQCRKNLTETFFFSSMKKLPSEIGK